MAYTGQKKKKKKEKEKKLEGSGLGTFFYWPKFTYLIAFIIVGQFSQAHKCGPTRKFLKK